MRQELYHTLKDRISRLSKTPHGNYCLLPDYIDDKRNPDCIVFKHIDLWNNNVQFLEQETAWERPAVFIEFQPVRWKTIVPGVQYSAEPVVSFHIVTDWNPDNEGFAFELAEALHLAVTGTTGRDFDDFTLLESLTNHNHEDIVESVEIYSYSAVKNASR